ncbi:hypothetical protein Kosp01_04320 [Kocuria sp. NBRC 114282]|nr:hypothetical protein Kosp01_04320 [Kocuria sp. NBRC 114282]
MSCITRLGEATTLICGDANAYVSCGAVIRLAPRVGLAYPQVQIAASPPGGPDAVRRPRRERPHTGADCASWRMHPFDEQG